MCDYKKDGFRNRRLRGEILSPLTQTVRSSVGHCRNCLKAFTPVTGRGYDSHVDSFCSDRCRVIWERRHARQETLLKPKDAGDTPKGSSHDALPTFGCVALLLVVLVTFHGPAAFLARCRFGIPFLEAVKVSVSCLSGWGGSAAIWLGLTILVCGVVRSAREKSLAWLLAGLCGPFIALWVAWASLLPINDKYAAKRLKEGKVASPDGLSSAAKGGTNFIELVSTDGKTIRAMILSVTGRTLFVRQDDGREFAVPLTSLTDSSRGRVFEWEHAHAVTR